MDDATFRFLRAEEAARLGDAVRTAYGETYDVRWVYDAEEVAARIAAGTYVACVAESPDGELLCHTGLSLAAAGDAVGHSGQAVTMPAARGRHLFTRTKGFLMDWARGEGLAGMYSEATAAHPYSQRAILELAGHETGFLLGWIPASVANDAAAGGRPRRRSAALFYTKLNEGRERPVYAPERHHEVIRQTLELCELREPGLDLETKVAAERHHLFGRAVDAIYLDLPLEDPATALLADHLERLGVSYSGIFPNHRASGDVLRFQSLHRARLHAGDLEVASDHGRRLLDYVLGDLPG